MGAQDFRRQIPEIPSEWHRHPECELTLTLNSRGLRFIADHIGEYDSHDLVLVPSEMPHTWASTKTIDGSCPHVAIVVWFTEAWASATRGGVPGIFFASQVAQTSHWRSELPLFGGRDHAIAFAGVSIGFGARPPSDGARCAFCVG
jgi:hypothetical protein